jgi:hypothetical protein
MNSLGSPTNYGGTCFAENADQLPVGWAGLNEDLGFQKTDSVVLVNITGSSLMGNDFAPSSYRAFQGSGTGGIAARLGISGPPAPGKAYNWLAYLVPGIWANSTGPINIVMVPEMAQDLQKYGFATKDAVLQWLWSASFVSIGDYKKYGWYDFGTNGGRNIEPTSGQPYGSLPDTYMTPTAGSTPRANLIIVTGGAEEESLIFKGGGGGGGTTRGTPVLIDPWR